MHKMNDCNVKNDWQSHARIHTERRLPYVLIDTRKCTFVTSLTSKI